MPDVRVPLDIKVVEIVCVFHLAKVWTLESLDDLCFHHSSDMSRQQGQQETLLAANKGRREEMGQAAQAGFISVEFHGRNKIIQTH